MGTETIAVSGAAGQLGRAIVRDLKHAGYQVFGFDMVEPSEDILNSIDYFETVDISDRAAVENALGGAVKALGSLDGMVCNAGVSVFEPFMERPEQSVDFVYQVNLRGTINCIITFLALELNNQTATPRSIVNVASMYGVVSPDPRIYLDLDRKNSEIYGATKAGVIQLTKYYAVHARNMGVRVNCVSPGGVLNEEEPQGEGFQKEYALRCPLGRLAFDHEIAHAISFLLSDKASYINGHNLVVDGGFSSW